MCSRWFSPPWEEQSVGFHRQRGSVSSQCLGIPLAAAGLGRGGSWAPRAPCPWQRWKQTADGEVPGPVGAARPFSETDWVGREAAPYEQTWRKDGLSCVHQRTWDGLFLTYSDSLPRERIKHCCEQLRALLPYAKGRKNDAASILEATVDYVKYIREKIPPAVMSQVFDSLALEFYPHR